MNIKIVKFPFESILLNDSILALSIAVDSPYTVDIININLLFTGTALPSFSQS
jgi:hypothetical protein